MRTLLANLWELYVHREDQQAAYRTKTINEEANSPLLYVLHLPYVAKKLTVHNCCDQSCISVG